MKDSRVYYEVTAFTNRSGQLIAPEPLKPGRSHIELYVTPGPEAANNKDSLPYGPRKSIHGDAQLTVNGEPAGHAHFANVNVNAGETLDVGSDLGSPVSSEYKCPNRVSGKIDQVTIEIK